MSIHYSHKLFTVADFTPKDFEQSNVLAIGVRDFNLKTCKVCGKVESNLSKRCGRR